MHHRKRTGNIEIIVHRRRELSGKIRRAERSNFVNADLLKLRRPRDETGQTLPHGLRLSQRDGRIGHRRPIVHGSQRVSQNNGRNLARHSLDSERVAERFAHFLPLDRHPRIMHPITREPTPRRVRLGLFVFVMRETQIDPTSVDVERLAQIAARHRRTFDMPPRPPAPPRRLPRGRLGLTRLGGLPQGEIVGVALIRLKIGLVDHHVLHRLASQRPVVGKAGDVKVHVSRIPDIGVAGVDNGSNKLDLIRDMPRRTRLVRRRKNP